MRKYTVTRKVTAVTILCSIFPLTTVGSPWQETSPLSLMASAPWVKVEMTVCPWISIWCAFLWTEGSTKRAVRTILAQSSPVSSTGICPVLLLKLLL